MNKSDFKLFLKQFKDMVFLNFGTFHVMAPLHMNIDLQSCALNLHVLKDVQMGFTLNRKFLKH